MLEASRFCPQGSRILGRLLEETGRSDHGHLPSGWTDRRKSRKQAQSSVSRNICRTCGYVLGGSSKVTCLLQNTIRRIRVVCYSMSGMIVSPAKLVLICYAACLSTCTTEEVKPAFIWLVVSLCIPHKPKKHPYTSHQLYLITPKTHTTIRTTPKRKHAIQRDHQSAPNLEAAQLTPCTVPYILTYTPILPPRPTPYAARKP